MEPAASTWLFDTKQTREELAAWALEHGYTVLPTKDGAFQWRAYIAKAYGSKPGLFDVDAEAGIR